MRAIRSFRYQPTSKPESRDPTRLNAPDHDRSSTPCIDPAGREYKTVQIGEQLWVAENLAYRPPTGNYWAYDNDPKNVVTYGYLYDWETAKKVCPAGWHLPTDDEWTALTDFLGGQDEAGGKMKSTFGWTNNGNGTNESGFSGVPGGFRNSINERHDEVGFYRSGDYGGWWSASTPQGSSVMLFSLYDSDGTVNRTNYDKLSDGFSVRCVKD